MALNYRGKILNQSSEFFIQSIKMKLNLFKLPNYIKAFRLFSKNKNNSILFITSLLRPREIRIATALRKMDWKVVLIYVKNTPIKPLNSFDIVIEVNNEFEAHEYASALSPPICHVFSGAIDDMVLRFTQDKPCPVVIDLNDIFCAALFNYLPERFNPTREALINASGFCSRDIQVQYAKKIDGFILPQHKILFPEYAQNISINQKKIDDRNLSDEVHVVSIGTFTLENTGMYDSSLLKIAKLLSEQKIHFHIYPHWFYQKSSDSSFNFNIKKDFHDYLQLEKNSPYVHVHKSILPNKLAAELLKYDFGIITGGCKELGQKLEALKSTYMASCYSGRISDFVDARLPIIINKEVKYNKWILSRYGVDVELEDIFKPGFKEKLLIIKRDPKRRIAIEKMAEKFSIDLNINRLIKFYNKVIDSESSKAIQKINLNLGARWEIIKHLPKLGIVANRVESRFRSLENELIALKNKNLIPSKYNKTDNEFLSLHEKGASSFTNQLIDRFGENWPGELVGLLNWKEVASKSEQYNGMFYLIDMLKLANENRCELTDFSFCWEVLAYKNLNQLLSHGYDNFKRTLGLNYFTFQIIRSDTQFEMLEKTISKSERSKYLELAVKTPDDISLDWDDQATYRYFLYLLAIYASSIDSKGYLNSLEEPSIGNPITIQFNSKSFSQDLGNSLIEYYSISEAVDLLSINNVLEIGAGYGRNAFIFLSLNPHIQYIIVDIPPALWVAQRYLSTVFPNRTVFEARDFDNYESVQAEMVQSSIVFLLPHQLLLLPNKYIDLSINISSFGEMKLNQIKAYFLEIDRVTKNCFYSKQWKVSQNAFDDVVILEDDYVTPPSWNKIYSRTTAVQPLFFESIYSIKDK